MNMIISCVSEKEDPKIAYVRFEEEDGRFAEAIIPDCKVEKNEGFTDDEVSMLEEYLSENLEMIKRKAAEVNPIRAMMKDEY